MCHVRSKNFPTLYMQIVFCYLIHKNSIWLDTPCYLSSINNEYWIVIELNLSCKIGSPPKIWILCGENRCLSFSRQSSRGEREPLKLDSVAGRDFISIAIFNQWGIFSSAGRNLHLIGQCCFNGEFLINGPLQETKNTS